MSLGAPSGATGRSSGPWVVLLAVVGFFVLVLVVVGGAVALRLGPFTRPPVTPAVTPAVGQSTSSPTAQPEASQTAVPIQTVDRTDEPTPTPADRPTDSAPQTAAPTLPVSPGTPLGVLLSHVPSSVWASCSQGETGEQVLAAVDCLALDGAIALSYTMYLDTEAMHTAYTDIFRSAEIDADSGRCYEPDADGIRATRNHWPAEHGYSVADQRVGRYLCLDVDGQPSIAWTDERFEILAIARATTDDLERFVTYWLNEAGPVP